MLPSIDMRRTGENLRRIMKEKKISVKTVQEQLNLSGSQSIYKWFNGKGLPSIDNLYALSYMLRVPIDRIICGNSPYMKEYFHEVEINSLKRAFLYYIRSHIVK